MADFPTLVTQRYVKPAAYIGQLIIPGGGALTGVPRLPLFVGKGSRYMLSKNDKIRRSFVYEEELAFPVAAPYEATLQFQSNGDKTRARIYKSDGTEVPQSKWIFQTDVVDNDQVLIQETAYDPNVTYYIDYQSVDRDVEDPIPFEDVHRVTHVSVNVDQEQYEEFVDFYLPTTIIPMTRDYSAHDISSSMGDIGTPDGNYNEYLDGSCKDVLTDMSSDDLGFIFGESRVHWEPDLVNVVTAPDATPADELSAATLANQARMVYNLHILEPSAIHQNADISNDIDPITFPDAGGEGGPYPNLFALTVALQTSYDYHITDDNAGAGPGTLTTHMTKYDTTYGTTVAAPLNDADLAGMVAALNDVKAMYNQHIAYTYGLFKFDASSGYTHKYTRDYRLELINVAGPAYTFKWQSTPAQPGYAFDSDATVPDPIQPPFPTILEDDPAWGITNVFTVTVGTPLSYIQPLENGIVLDFTEGVDGVILAGYNQDDFWAFTAYGISLVELDERLLGTNQFTDYSTSQISAVVTDGTMGFASTNEYNGLRNRRYRAVCTAVGVGPPMTATFFAVEFGEMESLELAPYRILPTFTLTDGATVIQLLDQGVVIEADFGTTGFTEGDEFEFAVRAPRLFYKAHDNRYLRVSITGVIDSWVPPVPPGGVGPPLPITNTIDMYFATTTYEGGFGTATATYGIIGGNFNPLTDPYVDLGENVLYCVRNVFPRPRHSSARTDGGNDRHDVSFTLDGTIDWDLQTEVTEVVSTDDILLDGLGNVTSVPGSYYLRLNKNPDTIMSVTIGSPPVALAYTHLAGTTIIYFAALPGSAVSVTYRHRGSEPDPAQIYYFTAEYMRPASYFNTPIRLIGKEKAKTFLAPGGTANDLAIMAQIAFGVGGTNLQGIYIVQVKDSDEDGEFTDFDYETAITASEQTDQCSDIIVLNRWTVLGALLSSLNRMADPFSKKTPTGFGRRLGWLGAPPTVSIGDVATPGSLIYTAKNTLQVYGKSPAHGTRILVGSRSAKTVILMEDTGLQVEVNLDGSFIAGALASLTDSFTDNADVILRKIVDGGLYDMEIHSNEIDLQLGAAQVLFMENKGDEDNPVYRCGESFTTDNYAEDFREISAMAQKQQLEVEVRYRLDERLIGYVPRTQGEGVAYVKGQLVAVLKQLVSAGYIAPYQDADGNVRKINPSDDVKVAIREGSKTIYDYIFAAWLRYPIKFVFGLYTVDTNDFSLAA